MAGRGTRTQSYSNVPKPLLQIGGKTLFEISMGSFRIPGNYIFIVRNYGVEEWDSSIHNLINAFDPNSKIISIDYTTDGPASTCMLAKEFINNDDELIISNIDHYLEWDIDDFIKSTQQEGIDALVTTWDKIATTESFIELDDNGFGIRVKEKEIISDKPLNGIHYWRKGKYFVQATKRMIREDARASNGEFYISESFNYTINYGLKVSTYDMSGKHWPLGTTEDIEKFTKYHGYS